MELRHLRYFVAVAEELHFTRAATRLHIAQPPLSQQISQLEEELGVRLLNRTRRRVELTEPGRQFLASAKEILAQVDLATFQARRVAQGEVGRINLGMSSSVTYEDTLPKVLRAYRASYPDVTIHVQEMSPGEQVEALRQGRIQIGFLRTIRGEPGLSSTLFYREPLIMVLPADHPLAARKRISLRALAEVPFIVIPQSQTFGGQGLLMEACLKTGFTPRIAQEAATLQSVISFVAAGFGASLVPASVRKLTHSGVAFVELFPQKIHFEISAVYLTQRPSPLVDTFLGVLKATL